MLFIAGELFFRMLTKSTINFIALIISFTNVSPASTTLQVTMTTSMKQWQQHQQLLASFGVINTSNTLVFLLYLKTIIRGRCGQWRGT
jgi:hypothetical protein